MPKILDKPLSWGKITGYIGAKEFKLFGRSKEVLKEYRKDVEKNKDIYNSPEDMIKIKYLNFKPVTAKNNKLVAMCKKKMKGKLICNNTFPYYVEEGIGHKLLWATKELNDKEINKYLSEKLFGLEYIYFRNPLYLRSIPELFHIHIFIKYVKDEDEEDE